MATTQEMVRRERERIADWVEALPAEVWGARSLCRRWRVGDVVGHLTFPWRVSTPRLLVQMARHRGFNRASALNAPGLAAIGREGLVRELREQAANPMRPPGTMAEDLLAEVVVHPLDIAVAVDVAWEPEPEATRRLLDHVTVSKLASHYQPKGGWTGVRFVATDDDWAWGEGEEVRAPAADLALAVTGRPVDDRLEGPGVPALAAGRTVGPRYG